MTDFTYVCNWYRVPACLNREVTVDGRTGVITASRGQYIGVTFDDERPTHIHCCHPTWKVVYGGIREPRKVTPAQRRYQEYLRSEVDMSFAEWMGFARP